MLTSLAIHVESWVQEEIAAQSALDQALDRTESAARSGQTVELETSGRRLQGLLATTGARESRRRVLMSRLASELGIAAREVTLSRLARELEGRGIDARRLNGLRTDLRSVVANVVRKSRRLEAVAHYHQGLFEELYGALLPAGASAQSNTIVDEEG